MSKIGTFGAILVIAMLSMMTAMAEDVSSDGMPDPAVANIVMKATPTSITIMNLGTAPRDIGGFRLITKESNGNSAYKAVDVAKLPYTEVLVGNPYPEATDGFDEVQPNYFKYAITVPNNQVLPIGTKVYLTNGVGTITTAIVG